MSDADLPPRVDEAIDKLVDLLDLRDDPTNTRASDEIGGADDYDADLETAFRDRMRAVLARAYEPRRTVEEQRIRKRMHNNATMDYGEGPGRGVSIKSDAASRRVAQTVRELLGKIEAALRDNPSVTRRLNVVAWDPPFGSNNDPDMMGAKRFLRSARAFERCFDVLNDGKDARTTFLGRALTRDIALDVLGLCAEAIAAVLVTRPYVVAGWPRGADLTSGPLVAEDRLHQLVPEWESRVRKLRLEIVDAAISGLPDGDRPAKRAIGELARSLEAGNPTLTLNEARASAVEGWSNFGDPSRLVARIRALPWLNRTRG